MGWSWESTVMETEEPEKTMERMGDLGLVEDKSDLTVVDDQTVHTKKKWKFYEKPIRYKKLLRLSDLVDRLAILRSTEHGNLVKLLEIKEDKVDELEIVSSPSYSFLKDYYYQKYDIKVIPDLIQDWVGISYVDDLDFSYEKSENLDQLFEEYEDTDFEFHETEGKYSQPDTARNKSDYYQESDYFYIANSKVIQELNNFFQEKGFELHSDSMRHYFEMSISYQPDFESLRAYSIPIKKVKDNFTDKELASYIRDLAVQKESFSRNYSENNFFLTENLKDGMNYPPNPKNVYFDSDSFEVHINEKSLGELQCSIAFFGEIELEELSDRLKFVILFSYSWLSENPEEELEEVKEICELPLRTLLSMRISSILNRKLQ